METRILLLMQDLSDGDAKNREINGEWVMRVDRLLAGSGIPPDRLALEVILGSRGGHPHAAFKLARLLRHRAVRVRFHIFDAAKSAATLIALAGDEIVMGVRAELGPLDMQAEHRNLEGLGPMSALEAIRPINYFAEIGATIAFAMAEKIREEWGMSRKDALTLALHHAEQVLLPVFSKLEPSLVSQAERQLSLGEFYATELLHKHHFGGKGEHKTIAALAKTLVWRFPDHGYVIWRDLARSIGLKVVDSEQEPLWNVLERAYDANGGAQGCVPSLHEISEFLPPNQQSHITPSARVA